MDIDRQEIAAAIREYNAARNSLRRATDRLGNAMETGVTVFHRLPGNEDAVETSYWTYAFWCQPHGDDRVLRLGASRGTTNMARGTTTGIIIEAPAPDEEYLPPLPATSA